MKKFTFVFLGLITLVACEAELETENANSFGEANGLTRSGLTISPEEAAAQAIEFRNSLVQGNGLTRSSNQDKAVASVYAWRSSDIAPKASTRSTASDLLPDTLLYIVNFEDSCGYALVSANEVVPGVMAYIEEGSLSPNQDIVNPGFQNFLSGIGKFIGDSIKAISDSLKYHDKDSILQFTKNDTTPVLYRDYYRTVLSVGPLLSTKWGQYGPYNRECPIDAKGRRSLAGCVAIAIAQVAAYYRNPSSYNGHIYNWDAILHNSEVRATDSIASQSVAELIHDIGELVEMKYSSEVSTAYFDSIHCCLDAFNYHYFYNNTALTDFPTIKNDIGNLCPVIIDGTKYNTEIGHAWVIDGAVVKRQSITNNERQYVHCNWGDGGSCDGYFIFQAFNTMWDINTDTQRTDYYGYAAQYYGYNYRNFAYHQVYPINK